MTAGRYFVLAASCLFLGACATRGETPSLPWLIAANIRSLAGMPPTPPDFYSEPVLVSATPRFAAVTAGNAHTCALDLDGDTYCWGSNQYRQLGNAELTERCGNGTFTCSSTPVHLEGAPRFTALAASIWGTCGLDGSGSAHCWGFGFGGAEADRSLTSSGVPVEISGSPAFVTLDSSPTGQHTCGLTPNGQAWCWGFEPSAGGGFVFVGPDPITASSQFVSIDVGGGHSCAVDTARNAVCWGGNQFGQLGAGVSGLSGGLPESPVPVAVQGGLELEHVAAGASFSCGLDVEGSLYCWGSGFPASGHVRVADRRTIPHGALPIRLWTTDPKWVEIGSSATQTCGLSANRKLYCFTATPTARDRRPAQIESDEVFIAFAVGGSHACAIGTAGHAHCWGYSNVGQAGRPPEGRGT